MIFSNKPEPNKLPNSDKVRLCKEYIGVMFHKSTSIINHYRTHNGLIYVEYTRPDDSTNWKYVCSIENDKMVWAAWFPDTQEWGRWRFEDEVNLKFKPKFISFQAPDTGRRVVIASDYIK